MSKKKVHKYVIEREIHFWSMTEEGLNSTDVVFAIGSAKRSIEHGLARGNYAGEFEDVSGKYKGNWTCRMDPKY